MMHKISLRSLSEQALTEFSESVSLRGFRVKQLRQWVHRGVPSFDAMTNLPVELRRLLEERSYVKNMDTVQIQSSRDGTKKVLFRLLDGEYIESVFMKYEHGNSACISTQVGCKMGCTFCATAIGGFKRQLDVGEMIGQIYELQNITGERIDSVVLMGSGEPLDNYDRVVSFIRLVSEKEEQPISKRAITVSTVGLCKGIVKLAEEGMPVTLAISLHNPFQAEREKIMPLARQNPIDELVKSAVTYYNKTKRRITFEYALIKGVNDGKRHAKELVRLFSGKGVHINLIPVNKVEETEYTPPSKSDIEAFKQSLTGISVTVRRELGSDISAACGQLRNQYGGSND